MVARPLIGLLLFFNSIDKDRYRRFDLFECFEGFFLRNLLRIDLPKSLKIGLLHITKWASIIYIYIFIFFSIYIFFFICCVTNRYSNVTVTIRKF